MQKTRLYIKRQFPQLYQRLRSSIFPTYLYLTAKRRRSFTAKQVKRVTCLDQSFLIVLDPENGFVDTEIYTSGVYEPDILAVIKQHLPRNGIFIDIGSNIGQHALFAASVVGPSGSVVAFEPIPRLVSQLTESIRLNNFQSIISLNAIACSDTEGEVTIRLRPGNIGGSGLHHTDPSYSKVFIKTSKADTYIANLPKVDLIKIDTEGHEVETLRGLEQTLAQHKPKIIVEFSPSLRENKNDYSENFFTLLQKYSYSFYDLEEGEMLIQEPQTWALHFTKTQTNLLCLPNNT